jgi:peroxiredoxin
MKASLSPSQKTAKSLAILFLGLGLILIGTASVMLIPRAEANRTGVAPAKTRTVSVIPAPVDFPAPELRLSDLSGESFALSDFAGQVVLINNWAIWCPPCRRELPDLDDFYLAYRHQDFVIIGIEAGSPRQDVELFLNETRLSFPIWLDPTELALDAFRNFSLPSSYVIDRTGQVHLAWTGAISYAMVEKYVAPLLSE